MEVDSNFVFLAVSIGFVSTALLTYFVMKVGLRKGVLDVPTDRSSHTAPIPRGGGLAIIISFLIFLWVYPRIYELPFDVSTWRGLLLGGTTIAVVGVFDDLNHIPARWRFLVHLFAAVLSLSMLTSLPEVEAFGRNFNFGPLGIAFFAVSLVWFINLFNFMDGVDGIAGVEAISSLGAGALIMFVLGHGEWLVLFAYLAACVAGFLVWNWPPAKVFLGDAGSGFLGFALGFLAIVTSTSGVMNIWSWTILFGVFITDAMATLVTRLMRGEKVYEAHRSHAYQILSRRYGSHSKVSLGVLVINIVWLLPLAFLAAKYSYWAMAICSIALAPLLFVAVRVGAGKREVEC